MSQLRHVPQLLVEGETCLDHGRNRLEWRGAEGDENENAKKRRHHNCFV
jgi:hypothetical protein